VHVDSWAGIRSLKSKMIEIGNRGTGLLGNVFLLS
jgi:hypothetical protein